MDKNVCKCRVTQKQTRKQHNIKFNMYYKIHLPSKILDCPQFLELRVKFTSCFQSLVGTANEILSVCDDDLTIFVSQIYFVFRYIASPLKLTNYLATYHGRQSEFSISFYSRGFFPEPSLYNSVMGRHTDAVTLKVKIFFCFFFVFFS